MTTTLQKIETAPQAHPKPTWFNTTFAQIDENGQPTKFGDQLVFSTLDERDLSQQDYVSFFTIRQESDDFFTHECISWAEYYYVYGNRFNKTLTVLPKVTSDLFAKRIGLVDVSLRFETKRNGLIYAILIHQWPTRPAYIRRFVYKRET